MYRVNNNASVVGKNTSDGPFLCGWASPENENHSNLKIIQINTSTTSWNSIYTLNNFKTYFGHDLDYNPYLIMKDSWHKICTAACSDAHSVSEQDLGMDYYVIGESFETSVPWDR